MDLDSSETKISVSGSAYNNAGVSAGSGPEHSSRGVSSDSSPSAMPIGNRSHTEDEVEKLSSQINTKFWQFLFNPGEQASKIEALLLKGDLLTTSELNFLNLKKEMHEPGNSRPRLPVDIIDSSVEIVDSSESDEMIDLTAEIIDLSNDAI